MDKYLNVLMAVLLVLGLTLGFVGHQIIVPEKTVINEVAVKGDPYAVEKIVEVEKVVVVDDTTTLENALKEFWAEFEDDDGYWTCDGDDYSFEDIKQRSEIREFTVSKDVSLRDTETAVEFSIDLKFADDSDERPCYESRDVEVVFHTKASEDTEVTIA